jgi:hypothetical protein
MLSIVVVNNSQEYAHENVHTDNSEDDEEESIPSA